MEYTQKTHPYNIANDTNYYALSESRNGDKIYRVQLDLDGVFRKYTSIDSGKTWTSSEICTIDNLDDKVNKTWTAILIGDKSVNIHNLPNDAEIYVIVLVNEGSWFDAIEFTLNKHFLNISGDDYRFYTNGWYKNVNENCTIRIGANQDWITLNYAYINNNDVTELSSTNMWVYYR